MSDASDTLWKQYVDAYHAFWDYVEEHEEILQEGSNVTLVRGIMEECPVVNFSCVRDLSYTMRQFWGEKRFKEKEEGQWRARLWSKIDKCIAPISSKGEESEEESEEEDEDEDMEITSEADLGVEVTPSLHKCPLTYHVMKEFTKRTGHLLEKQDCLRELPAKIYERQVYGQDVFRQQALILNWNILCTFCRNLIRHSKVKPSYCGKILWSLARTQAAGYYIRESSQRTVQTFMRNSIFPLHEPVVGSYDNRKAALFKRWEAFKRPKCIMPPIYTPLVHSGDVVGFQKTTKDKVTFKSLPQKIASSRHFERVKDIVQSENYALNHDERDPTMQSNWLYYCVMFDPTVSPEAADQGYIGATNRDLVTRWKEHTGPKGKHDEMLIHYNLALVSQYARQRGEDISKYVAVFALGTTTDESALRATEGELIRESFRGGFGVTNMQYGMNSKQSSAKQQPRRKIPIHQKSRTLMKKTIGRLHGLPKHTLSKHTILWHRN